MGKRKKGKGEKLSHILSELQKLKAEVKALGKQQADLAVGIDKLSAPKKAAAKPSPKAAKKRPKPVAARKAAVAPKRPVLVPPPSAAAKAG